MLLGPRAGGKLPQTLHPLPHGTPVCRDSRHLVEVVLVNINWFSSLKGGSQMSLGSANGGSVFLDERVDFGWAG